MTSRAGMALAAMLAGGLIGAAAVAPPAPQGAPPPAQTEAIEDGNKFPLPPDEAAPAAERGRLAVKAVQGTPGGDAIAAAPLTVQLFHEGMLIDVVEANLDEHGVVVLEGLPVTPAVVPVVAIEHAGVVYRQAGSLMSSTALQQMVEVTCYEATEEAPLWTVGMRHVILKPAPEGVAVTEVVVVENPTDRTWVGPADGSRSPTTSLVIAETAQNITLGPGFEDGCCTSVLRGDLINSLPLRPGKTEMMFGYLVPAVDGAVSLTFAAPVAVTHTMVIVPAEMSVEAAAGLSPSEGRGPADANVSYLVGGPYAAGQTAQLQVVGADAGAGDAQLAGAESGRSAAKIVAAVGGVLLLAVAIVVIFKRSPAGGRREPADAGS
jgi:hypothetical protein